MSGLRFFHKKGKRLYRYGKPKRGRLRKKHSPKSHRQLPSVLTHVKKAILYVVVEILIGILVIGSVVLFLLILKDDWQIQNSALRSDISETYPIHDYPSYDSKRPVSVSARSAVVYEKESKVVIYGKNEYIRLSPASSAKIMTALVALDYYPLDQVISAFGVSSVLGSKMYLEEGEKMTVLNMLYGLLLPSGNDAAYVLAENYPGGVPAFVQKMNEKAASLDLYNTHFIDPSGYGDGNYSTAYDLAHLASYALDEQVFQRIVGTKSKTVFDQTGKIGHKLTNLNELLSIPGVTGVKTGFTNEAGEVLVTSLITQGKTFISVVMKSDDRFADTKKLIDEVIEQTRFVRY